ncbi:SCO-spondin-like [Glandiceps talaboti]
MHSRRLLTCVFTTCLLQWLQTPAYCQCPVVEDDLEPADCVMSCYSDYDCQQSQICCKVSPTSPCRHECYTPVQPSVQCINPDTQQYLDVGTEIENSIGQCCSCLPLGELICENDGCVVDNKGEPKPGICPSPGESQLCGELGCHGDNDCPTNQKCCDAIQACLYRKTCHNPLQGSIGCTENRNHYLEGDVIEVMDSCNNCTCTHGEIVCSHNICPDVCIFKEKQYKSSETRIKGKGNNCSVCTCSNGKWDCSEPCKFSVDAARMTVATFPLFLLPFAMMMLSKADI